MFQCNRIQDDAGSVSTIFVRKNSAGFTVFEVMISVALFSILAGIAITGFVRVIRLQRHVSAIIASDNNIALVLEQMAREMRTGRQFCTRSNAPHCGGAPQIETESVCFTNGFRETVVYEWDSVEKRVMRGVAAGTGSEPDGALCADAVANLASITGENARIEHLSFLLFGHEGGDNHPPRVTILIGASPRTSDQEISQSVLHFQTTVSGRLVES